MRSEIRELSIITISLQDGIGACNSGAGVVQWGYPRKGRGERETAMTMYSTLEWQCDTTADVTMKVCFDHFTAEVTEWITTIGLTSIDGERDVITVAEALLNGRKVAKEWISQVGG